MHNVIMMIVTALHACTGKAMTESDNTGAIVGGIVAGLVVISLIVVVAFIVIIQLFR